MRKNKHFVTFRTPSEEECEVLDKGLISPTEWLSEDSYKRIFDESWELRYQYEAEILGLIINNNECKKIIELGPGPGLLCKKITTLCPELEYHLIDIEAAKIANEKENLGGIFHVQDLTNNLDISNLPKDIDLFIANDFLEHIQNPANVILQTKSCLKKDGLAFISVPNWRMGHAWIYRGLFDWDNFIHFMWQHGFAFEGCVESPIKCSSSPQISSESTMPENMLNSWNWYMLFRRNDNE